VHPHGGFRTVEADVALGVNQRFAFVRLPVVSTAKQFVLVVYERNEASSEKNLFHFLFAFCQIDTYQLDHNFNRKLHPKTGCK
jgi:hypothetical protein